MKKLHFWLRNARWGSLPQSLMPALTAVILAIGEPGFSAGLSALAVFGVCMAHLCCNLLDDYFDYRSHETGYRDTLARAGIRAYTGKCPYIVDGSATVQQLFLACCIFGLCAVIPGVIIFAMRGWTVLLIVAITAFLGIEYSGPPFRFGYHGLGEPVIGFLFGPLNMIGCSIAACGRILPIAVTGGICLGLLVVNILYTHSVLDREADLSVGKITLASLFRTSEGRLAVSGILIFVPDLLVVCAAAARAVSPWYLLCLLTLPWGIALFRSMADFRKDPHGKVKRRKWYGPMSNWEAIRKAGLDWFLLRWLLARNLLTLFAAAMIAACILEKV